MISKELQQTLDRSLQEAATRKHEYITLEHLLYVLTKEKTASEAIVACGGNLDELRKELDKFLNDSIEKFKNNRKQDPEPSVALERVISRAIMQAQSSGQATIDGGNVLVAMFEERHSQAVYLLEKQGITKLDVLNWVSHGISKFASGPTCAPSSAQGFG